MKCCDLYAGKLIHPIIIERESDTPDGRGGSVVTWSTAGTAMAWVSPQSGNESSVSDRLEANITHRIFTRYGVDVRTTDRISYAGRKMQVKAVLNLEERGMWLQISAVEGEAT